MGNDDDVREVLNQAAKEMADRQSNPRAWQSWVVYLLSKLEEQATNGGAASRESFIDMLSSLQDALRNRQRTGGW